jgi:hypothetical protein
LQAVVQFWEQALKKGLLRFLFTKLGTNYSVTNLFDGIKDSSKLWFLIPAWAE